MPGIRQIISSTWALRMTTIFVILLAILLSGCFPTASDDSCQELDLAFGQADTLADGITVLRFTGLLEDSRCPVGVYCFWEGNGRVLIAASRETADSADLELNTALEPRTAEFGFYRIDLIELTPYPVFEVVVDTSAYRVLLRVTRSN